MLLCQHGTAASHSEDVNLIKNLLKQTKGNWKACQSLHTVSQRLFFEYMNSSQTCHWYNVQAISPLDRTRPVAHNKQPLHLTHLLNSTSGSILPSPNYFKNVVAFWKYLIMFSDYQKTVQHASDMVLLKNTPTGFLLEHENERGLKTRMPGEHKWSPPPRKPGCRS